MVDGQWLKGSPDSAKWRYGNQSATVDANHCAKRRQGESRSLSSAPPIGFLRLVPHRRHPTTTIAATSPSIPALEQPHPFGALGNG
jgi:hypothetical protein